jgi:hypothetical protein
MGKNRYINTQFWSDPWVVDVLDPLTCHLFMYLLTNGHTTVAGVYEISLRTIAFEVKIEQAEVERMLERLKPKVHYVDGFIILRNGIKNQNYKNSKIATGIKLVLDAAPSFVFDYLAIPADFDLNDIKTNKNMNQQSLIDESSMSHGESSHSNSNVDSKSKPNVNSKVDDNRTTGDKNLEGRKYSDITMLYEDLKAQGLVNEEFKAWYCSAFFKIGRDKVLVLSSQARADGKDPQKLFNHLIQKESGMKQSVTASG